MHALEGEDAIGVIDTIDTIDQHELESGFRVWNTLCEGCDGCDKQD